MGRVHGEYQSPLSLARCPDPRGRGADALSYAALARHIDESHIPLLIKRRFNCFRREPPNAAKKFFYFQYILIH
jgi:hypothetical protein